MPTSLQTELASDPAALKARLEALYTEHHVDEAVAKVLEVSVSTLKRTLAKLGEAGHAPTITRTRGRRWSADPKARRRSTREARA